MNDALLESLLYRAESEALDFKEGQYAFASATTEQKAEILKDILAFANAWRDTEARILIGVREVKHAKSIVVGIAEHLDDHSLQQFVNAKTNRPITFSYSAFATSGVQIGMLTLAVSDQRPFFLNQDFGKLRKNAVYIRRGSSTDEATPDEVLSMAAKSDASQPVLELQFCDGSTREGMGQAVEIYPKLLKLPDSHAFPCYGNAANYSLGSGFTMPSGSMDNNDYYADFAKYLSARHLFVPVSVAVSNPSEELAESVIVTIRIDFPAQAADEDGFPDRPSRHSYSFAAAHPALARSTTVGLYGSTYEIKVVIGDVQPGRTVYSEQPFYLSSREDTDITVEAVISANNLRAPITIPLAVTLRPETVEITVAQVVQFADRA